MAAILSRPQCVNLTKAHLCGKCFHAMLLPYLIVSPKSRHSTDMITSGHENALRITKHLCRELPVNSGFPSQRTINADLWCFFVLSLNKLLNKQLICQDTHVRSYSKIIFSEYQWRIKLNNLATIFITTWEIFKYLTALQRLRKCIMHFIAFKELKHDIRL